MGPGSGWAGGLDPACREAEHLSVRGAYRHWADLVTVLPGHYSKELEPLRCQLLRWCRWQFPALQDLEVQPGAESQGEGGAVLSRPSRPIPSTGPKKGTAPHWCHVQPLTLTFQSDRAFLIKRKGALIFCLFFFFYFFNGDCNYSEFKKRKPAGVSASLLAF